MLIERVALEAATVTLAKLAFVTSKVSPANSSGVTSTERSSVAVTTTLAVVVLVELIGKVAAAVVKSVVAFGFRFTDTGTPSVPVPATPLPVISKLTCTFPVGPPSFATVVPDEIETVAKSLSVISRSFVPLVVTVPAGLGATKFANDKVNVSGASTIVSFTALTVTV